MHLTAASQELFRRSPDERFESLQDLWEHCNGSKEKSRDHWHAPSSVIPRADSSLQLEVNGDGSFFMNNWSFSQLCRLAGVAKETVNRLSAATARQVFAETMPQGSKPLQVLTAGQTVRSIHGTQYTRLWNADLVMMLREFAVDFQPPQKGMNGATGLYAGEEDMFCFLIDPLGWAEIEGQSFAPGFFVWNSEVGRRSLGVQTFWFQAVCQNHIVWDATEVIEWSRKHTARVGDGLPEIRQIIEGLVKKRDARKDGFTKVIAKAMAEKLGDDAEEAAKALTKKGITRALAKKAVELAATQGRLTIWSVVDAMTRLAQESENIGDRMEVDEKASGLLSLVS
jgi:hypothetical protein